MEEKIIEAPFTSGEPVTLRAQLAQCSSKLERYEKIERIINEYRRQISGNVFTNDKYFRRILEVFEVD